MADNRNTRNNTRAFSIGFVTALVRDEMVPCTQVLASSGWSPAQVNDKLDSAGITAWEKPLNGNIVRAYIMPINHMGQTTSALETYLFLERCNPTDVYLVGIAGSLREWVHKRDVVVAKGVHWKSQNGISGDKECDEYRPFRHEVVPYDPDFLRRFSIRLAENFQNPKRQTDSDGIVHTHFEKIFTWDYVIDSKRVVEKVLSEYPDAHCVEMEAGGFLAAISRYSKVRSKREMTGVIVRGISDYAWKKDWDEDVRADATRNAMKVALALGEWRALERLNGTMPPTP